MSNGGFVVILLMKLPQILHTIIIAMFVKKFWKEIDRLIILSNNFVAGTYVVSRKSIVSFCHL